MYSGSGVVTTHPEWTTVQSSIFSVTPCVTPGFVVTVAIQAFSATAGVLHVRINGNNLFTDGISILINDLTKVTWPVLVPVFGTETRQIVTIGQASVGSFDTSKSFDGDIAELLVYSRYIDPLIDDHGNLRLIEAIEWHLATKWISGSVMMPSKPTVPIIVDSPNPNYTRVNCTRCSSGLTVPFTRLLKYQLASSSETLMPIASAQFVADLPIVATGRYVTWETFTFDATSTCSIAPSTLSSEQTVFIVSQIS